MAGSSSPLASNEYIQTFLRMMTADVVVGFQNGTERHGRQLESLDKTHLDSLLSGIGLTY
jgi:hypothetical protein